MTEEVREEGGGLIISRIYGLIVVGCRGTSFGTTSPSDVLLCVSQYVPLYQEVNSGHHNLGDTTLSV